MEGASKRLREPPRAAMNGAAQIFHFDVQSPVNTDYIVCYSLSTHLPLPAE